MKIAMLSTSAVTGGAAIAASRLAAALTDSGQEVEMFTLDGIKREYTFPFLAERAEIFLRNGLNRSKLFKVSTAAFGRGDIVGKVLASKPDVILLGWINQGLLSLRQVERLADSGIPLVWVMHDMWNFTGICHYSMGCNRFTGRCGHCPMISGTLRREYDLSREVWERKNRLYERSNIHFVAVSNWLAGEARRSALLRDREVTVVPNVFPVEDFAIGEKEPGLIVMGAARLDDPIKGLHHAIGALNRLKGHPTAHVKFFGALRNPEALSGLTIPYEHLGPLAEREVGQLMSGAQVVLSSALYETFGLTLIEGQASGAMPVSFDRGGQVDIIEHHRSGYLAPFGNEAALARGVEWALEGNVAPAELRAEVERKFSAKAVSERMNELFATVLC